MPPVGFEPKISAGERPQAARPLGPAVRRHCFAIIRSQNDITHFVIKLWSNIQDKTHWNVVTVNIFIKISETLTNGMWAGIVQPVKRLAMGSTVRGSNPGRGEIFRNCLDPPLGHPIAYNMGIRSFPGVKRTGCGVNHPHSSSAEVKERV